RAVDDLTLRFKLTEPFPQFLLVLAMHVYAPVPREAVDYWLGTESDGAGGRRSIPLDKRATEFSEAQQVVGTGPYILKEFTRKSKIVLMRNPDFRDEFYPTEGEEDDKKAGLLDDAGKKVPFIDVFQFDFVSQGSSGWMLFLTKQRDATGIPEDVFDSIINPDKQLEKKWRKKNIYFKSYWSPAVYWIVFNMEDEVVGSSKSLRQALCLSFDVESYLKVLFNNRGKRAVNILPSSFTGWKQAGPGPYYKFDPAAAKKIIEDAKMELDAKGLLVNGGIPQLTLDLPGIDSEMAKRAEFFRQQFAKIGVQMKTNLNDWPKLQEKVHNKQCQMYTMGWHADYPDAENFLQLFYSPNIEKQTNNSNYSNPEFDRLYEKVRVMPDTPERTMLYAKMVNMISEDCPVLLLTEPQSYVLIYDWVKNFKPHPIGYGYAKYSRIDTALRHKLGGKEK
ncbi:MAG: ABC transporter substrate-binding protein, partial [Planctomycetota bacterium]|nr:ABC transporter substrate-binding protein [Planctomycetota bacterium]